MELKGSFIRRLQFSPSRMTKDLVKRNKKNSFLCFARLSPNRDTFPASSRRWKKIEVQCKDSSQNVEQLPVPQSDVSEMPEFSFDRLPPSEHEYQTVDKLAFGRFVARGALLDEEYWEHQTIGFWCFVLWCAQTAAWLRAEAHWESMSYMRHVDSYKRKYAEQEFNALKRRCAGRDGNSLKCVCIVAVKKEERNARRTVLNSVVGTLDLSIRQFLQGETFPGEFQRASTILVSHEAYDPHRYAYVANVCVTKYARRQGIASNMLYLATDVAISAGMKKVFVHVNFDNKPAQELYRKTGFEVVEGAASPLAKDQRLLMCLKL